MAINIFAALAILGFLIYIRMDYFLTIWSRLFDDFFDDSGRFELYKEAWNNFKTYPLFGAGLFARVTDNYFGLYHNTILHTMATLGSIGLISLLWQFIEIMKMFLKRMTVEKAILFIALIGANIHGMVDNVYYMPQFMVIFFIIIASVENFNEKVLEVEIR